MVMDRSCIDGRMVLYLNHKGEGNPEKGLGADHTVTLTLILISTSSASGTRGLF